MTAYPPNQPPYPYQQPYPNQHPYPNQPPDPNLQPRRQKSAGGWFALVGVVAGMALYANFGPSNEPTTTALTSTGNDAVSAEKTPQPRATATKKPKPAETDEPESSPSPKPKATKTSSVTKKEVKKPSGPKVHTKPYDPPAEWMNVDYSPTKGASSVVTNPIYGYGKGDKNANAISIDPGTTVYIGEKMVEAVYLECVSGQLVSVDLSNKIDKRFTNASACNNDKLETSDIFEGRIPTPKQLFGK